MHFTLDHLPISLLTGIPLAIADSKGTSLHVLRGRIWVTEEDELDDVFLNEGSTHTLSARGRTVITAEGPPCSSASVIFEAPLVVHSPGRFPLYWRR